MNGESLIEWGGFAIVIAMVYVETGFLIGLVVPGGETLLFTTGLLAATGVFNVSIWLIIPVLIAAAIVGDITGYFIGKKLGDKLHQKKDTWYFKQRYLKKAEDFYKEKGAWALILGRFLPIVRTMNPLLCGTGKVKFKTFIWAVVLGVVAYISSLVLAGYFIGKQFPELKNYLKYVLPALVIVVLIPVILKFRKEKTVA